MGSGNIGEAGSAAAFDGNAKSCSDHSSHLSSGNIIARLEGAIGETRDYAEAGKNVNGFAVILGVLDIREIASENETEASQDHCEREYQRKYFLHS